MQWQRLLRPGTTPRHDWQAAVSSGRITPTAFERPLRVLVVDDSDVQRGLLAALFSADPDLEVVGRAVDGPEAIRHAATLRPDVITIDLRMPGMNGLEATRRIMQETPTPIVMVAAGISLDDRPLVSEALAAGVLAIVPKQLQAPAQVTAQLPDGSMIPLVWIVTPSVALGREFQYESPIGLPKGTRITATNGTFKVILRK